MPVSSLDSPWWEGVSSELLARPDLVGRTLTIEELAQTVPSYPDGRRPRTRAVARRLRPILELVERGPNGSLSRGATYRIRAPQPRAEAVPITETPDDELKPNVDWLEEQVRRMTGGK